MKDSSIIRLPNYFLDGSQKSDSSKECFEILGKITRKAYSNVINLPDAIWRTLCADRDSEGQTASSSYRIAMLYLLEASTNASNRKNFTNVFEQISSIDVEELLETDLPGYVMEYLKVVRDTIWNRRTFRSMVVDDEEGVLVGLVPQLAKVGDQVCILYGCSVPVILRKLSGDTKDPHWRLIGDAYVHGVIDGEAMRSASPQTSEVVEVEFMIR
ncbi:hypothetical protein N0V83_005728 [Neocucurbitaria cava]|uniref:Uncharacterized protein n=1 Tax=Neocucurbitaria cava TaxID=798079 RepID=A0A9W8Y7V0_9PLEO|nr:hypothetical protein N0V83_005728 [Neocucurbitaria cava]